MDFFVENAMREAEAFTTDDMMSGQANITVIGTGGAGNNMVDWLYTKGVSGAKIVAVNTDLQHLNTLSVEHKYLIGRDLTRGLGCGGFPEKGAEAAKENINELKESLKGSDMVFVCAGLGGGTGTGAAPVVAKIAHEMGAIVIGTVTMPFEIERARIDKAEFGIEKLRNVCDTVICIDNNRLVKIAGNLPVRQAFEVANELIATMIKGIVETIAIPSLVNLDFADVRAVMTNGDVAAIGVGASDTSNRVEDAVRSALTNPLLEINYDGATGAIIQITGGEDMTLEEVTRVGNIITKTMSEDATVIWGARIDENMNGKLTVMTIITGVSSPWITGKKQEEKRTSNMKRKFSEELELEMI